MKKLLLLVLILVYIISQSMAQNTANSALAFPSVNNNFLAKVVPGPSVAVDYYTGMAEVSVPICQLASRQLTIPVSVDYMDGRGVKAQEYASQVGLGWQLNAGGSITRVVRGFPDEMPNGYVGTGSLPAVLGIPICPSGKHWGNLATTMATEPPGSMLPDAQLLALFGFDTQHHSAIPTADGEPDIFYVKTPFFSFTFIYDQNGTPICSNNPGYKILSGNFLFTSSYQNPTFEIIDDQGNQFWFGETTATTEQSTDSLYNVPTTFISTWYLDKIVTYDSKDVITLSYQAAPTADVTYNYSYSQANESTTNFPVTTVSGMTTINTPKYVSTITSSEGEVDFTYAVRARMDDNNAEELTAITLKAYNPQTASNSTTLQTYNFTYSYFGWPSTDPNVIRLKLDGITVKGNTSGTSAPLTVASFLYNTAIPLPNRTWMAWDFWGFCSRTTNPNTDVIGVQMSFQGWSPNPSVVQAGILTNIYTAQGGMWQINYEPNCYGSSTNPVAGVRVTSIQQVLPNETSTTSTSTLTKSYFYVDQSNNPSGQEINGLYSQTFVNFPNVTSGAYLYLAGTPYMLNDLNGTFLGYSSVEEVKPNGGKTYYTFSNFNDVADADGVPSNDFIQPVWQTSGLSGIPYVLQGVDVAAKRGLLTDKLEMTATNAKISETKYSYVPQTAVVNDGYGIRAFTISTPHYSNSVLSWYYTPIENTRLASVAQTDYDQKNPTTNTPATTTTLYTYDAVDHRLIQGTSTMDSRLQTDTKTMYYSQDIGGSLSGVTPALTPTETTAINSMVSGYRTGAVIQTVENRNGTTSAMRTSYATAGNGRIYPASVSSYLADPVNPSYTLAKQQNLIYDQNSSQLVMSSPVGGTLTTTMWDYSTSLPVAKIVNANTGQYFYQGFETSGGNVSTSAHSGHMSYSGTYAVPFAVPDGRGYLIQWWSFSGGIWNFNQQAYTGPINLTGQIDDVRIFPHDALMTTYTYNPLVGKTSEIDPAGRAMTYQFDGLNRMQTVFDQDGNVLKTYAYGVQILPSTGSSGLSLTGVPGYSSGGPTTGQGQIFGPPGYLVTVTMYAMGGPTTPCGLNVNINGVNINGPTSVTQGTAIFTFIMPTSGVVGWNASLVPTGPGGGDFTIH